MLRTPVSAAFLLGLLLLVGGCSEQQQAPPNAPDTRTAGAGPAALASCGGGALPEEMLSRVNAARAAGRSCGARAMPPVPPLQWHPALQSAASGHAQDMARRNYFDHRSPEGTTVSQRASASRYPWKTVGENLAGGDTSVAGVVDTWLASPEHCSNLMDPLFQEMAAACVQRPGSELGTYWTLVLGRSR